MPLLNKENTMAIGKPSEFVTLNKQQAASGHVEPVVMCDLDRAKLAVATKVFNELLEDGFYGEYVLGEDLWSEFKTEFTKST